MQDLKKGLKKFTGNSVSLVISDTADEEMRASVASLVSDGAKASPALPPVARSSAVQFRRRMSLSLSGMSPMLSAVSAAESSEFHVFRDPASDVAVWPSVQAFLDQLPAAEIVRHPGLVLDFFALFHAEVAKVDAFYTKQYAKFASEVNVLSTQLERLAGHIVQCVVSPPHPHTSVPSVIVDVCYSDRQPGATDLHATRKVKLGEAAKELYRGLNFLMNFQVLNYTACVKMCVLWFLSVPLCEARRFFE